MPTKCFEDNPLITPVIEKINDQFRDGSTMPPSNWTNFLNDILKMSDPKLFLALSCSLYGVLIFSKGSVGVSFSDIFYLVIFISFIIWVTSFYRNYTDN